MTTQEKIQAIMSDIKIDPDKFEYVDDECLVTEGFVTYQGVEYPVTISKLDGNSPEEQAAWDILEELTRLGRQGITMMIDFKEKMDVTKKARDLVSRLVNEPDYLNQAAILREETNLAVLKEAVLIFRREYCHTCD